MKQDDGYNIWMINGWPRVWAFVAHAVVLFFFCFLILSVIDWQCD